MGRVQSRAAAGDAPERAAEGADKTLTLGEGVVQVAASDSIHLPAHGAVASDSLIAPDSGEMVANMNGVMWDAGSMGCGTPASDALLG
jgi:hypothetical protein